MAKVKMILNKEGHAKHGSIKEFSEAASKSPVLKTAGWIKHHAPKAAKEAEEHLEDVGKSKSKKSTK